MLRPVRVRDFSFSRCGMHIYLKSESYNLQSKNLVLWFIKMLIFMSKML